MSISSQKIKNLPDTPGVYFFLGPKTRGVRASRILYIGKATSLRDRVRSYFNGDILDSRSPLIKKMTEEAVGIDFKKTDSVLEALLLEADLIKKFHPPYNTKEKDDKSFLCVGITKEDFPRVLIIRKKDILPENFSEIFGPFPSSSQLKEALKIIRKIFPYRDDKCKLGSKRPCFNYTIGLCPGTCIGAIDKHCYEIRLRRIKLFLSGNIKKLVSDLTRDMKSLAKEQKFEAAKILRDKIYALNHIQDISLIKKDTNIDNSKIFRIEAYDVAHTSGQETVGVMTVIENGSANKNEYRKFNIKKTFGEGDTGALREILERRFAHSEWRIPNIVVVDGGKQQINVANSVIKSLFGDLADRIAVVSVLKGEGHKPKEILGDKAVVSKYEREILLSNNEAHRFAIKFHRFKLRKRMV